MTRDPVLFLAPVGDAVRDFRAVLPSTWLAREGWPARHVAWDKVGRELRADHGRQVWVLCPPALGLPGALVSALAQLPEIRVAVNLSPPPWCLPPWHPVWSRVPADYAFPVHRALARAAERVIVHDQAVVGAMGADMPTPLVIPDALEALPQPPPRRDAGRLRLAWLGSPTHAGDLELVSAPLRAFLARHADVTLTVLGGPVPAAWRDLEAVDGRLAWTSLEGCLAALTALAPDVLLMPLAPAPANEYRGGSALLLAGAVGAAVLASARGAVARELRAGESATLVDDAPEAWLTALEHLRAAPGRRRALAAGLRRWVEGSRLLAHTGPRWAAALAA